MIAIMSTVANVGGYVSPVLIAGSRKPYAAHVALPVRARPHRAQRRATMLLRAKAACSARRIAPRDAAIFSRSNRNAPRASYDERPPRSCSATLSSA